MTLTLATNVENLTLTGSSIINGTGNSANNIIIGNSANNSLNGGAGVDTLIGGSGNDTYVVDSTTDIITENTGAGTDIVSSSVTFSLAAIANVENLTLTGTNAINGTGNSLNNLLTGNSGNNTLIDSTGDDTLNGGAGVDTLIGGTGNDLYIIDTTTDIITENASEGIDTVQSSVTFSLAALTNIENLTLTGTTAINATGNANNNNLIGNTGNNTLTGNDGNDTLDGGTGIDTLIGGTGDDTYIVDTNTDVITENANEGTDTIQASVTFSLTSLVNIENLTLTGSNAINGTGNASNNILTGNTANNLLDGGTGVDTLIGGAGDDTYVVDNAADIITENVGEGTDTIQSSVTFSLASLPNIENLTLIGSSAINGTGNANNNIILGNTANNILDGTTGIDTLAGGTGDDTYIVDTTTDTITENVGEGTDTIQSSITFTLASLVNLENLTLTGSNLIDGTGNASSNILTGNSANNILDGGTGIDAFIGGAGDDTYVVDNSAETITENTGEGTDNVQSSATFSLATFANVENLTLTGSNTINGTGNAGNNILTGNTANNILDGGAGVDTLIGGTGVDTLIGGTENDTYIVDSTTDIITENAGAGTDTIQSSVTFTIASLANLENLTLTGSTAINGTGNGNNNILIGNSVNNVLNGGAGIDTLIGSLGNDVYQVDSITDVITENANEGTDTIQSSVTFSLATFPNIENLTLTGSSAINGTGNTANNSLTGNAVNNTLDGGDGNDTLNGGAGNDTLIGGNGNDFAYYYSSTGSVTVNLATGTASDGLGGTDTLSFIENVQGSNTAGDNLTGNTGVNVLYGYGGADILTGGGGNDLLYVGSDTVTDTVNYASGDGADTVYNFVRGVGGDILNFTGITAIDVQVSGTNTLFKVGDGISGNSGFGSGTLLLTTSATTGFVAADVNVNLSGATFAFS